PASAGRPGWRRRASPWSCPRRCAASDRREGGEEGLTQSRQGPEEGIATKNTKSHKKGEERRSKRRSREGLRLLLDSSLPFRVFLCFLWLFLFSSAALRDALLRPSRASRMAGHPDRAPGGGKPRRRPRQ